jgi:transglutaminase-like putative cysteine protease
VSRFEWLHRSSVLGTAALGFLALAVGGEMPPLAWAAAVLALGLFGWPRRPRLPGRVWIAVQLAFLAFFAVALFVLHRHVLSVFAWLLIFVQVHRLLTRESTRDDLYVCFIAFGQLLLSSVLTVDARWLLVFVPLLLLLVQALLLTRLLRAAEDDWRTTHGGAPLPAKSLRDLDALVGWRSLSAVSGLTLFLLVSTVALFFVLPRMQASFLGGALLPPLHVSGFADRVRLGAVGEMQLSDEPVLRARLLSPDGRTLPAADTYWFGLALDRFDGRAWSLSESSRIPLSSMESHDSRGPPRRAAWSVKQEVTLEPLDSRVLFHIAKPSGIYGDFNTLEAVDTEGFYLPPGRRRETYTVYSDPSLPDSDALRRSGPATSPPELLARYTQVPQSLSPEVRQLAEDWTRGAASPLDAALLVQGRLQREFIYNLDNAAGAWEDPLHAFLLRVQEGHCEYFATAMAVLLRARGIPARIVNGFLGGEWNPVGGYQVVRQRDAHSWVEVFFPEHGWIPFDPTPGTRGGVVASARLSALARVRAWTDYAGLLWSQVMLDYGLDQQASGVRALASLLLGGGDSGAGVSWRIPLLLPSGADSGTGVAGSGGRALLRAFLLLAGAAIIPAIAVAVRSRGAAGPPPLPAEIRKAGRQLQALLAGWERAARRAALPAPPSRAEGTALRWASWAATVDPARFGAAPLAIADWNAARFGGRPAPPDLARRLRGLRRATRGFARRPPRGAIPIPPAR